MVITRMIGGLGNQMFQYAAARAVACRIHQEIGLDVTSFENYRLRSYRLGCFNIIENIVDAEQIIKMKLQGTGRKGGLLHSLRNKLRPGRRQSIFMQQGHCFNADILKINHSVYLEGYWQSEKYFDDVSDLIRKEFTFRFEPRHENKRSLLKIEECHSVSLHIRRGDYVNDRETFNTHGVLSLDYYAKGVDYISKRIRNPVFFIFSDDMAWVRLHLKMDLPHHFIDHNGVNQDFEDLRLMSHCKHHIIANSSFSWWGAWLCNHVDKIVIAPERWFSEEEMKKRGRMDIVPDTWVVL